MRGGIASPHLYAGDSGELWCAVHGAEIDQAGHTTPEQAVPPGVIPVELPANAELLQFAHHVLHRDPHLGDLMVELPFLRAQRPALGPHAGNDHLMVRAQLVQARIAPVPPDASSPRQATQEPRLLEDFHVMGAPASGRTEVHNEFIRGHRHLGFEGVRALLGAEELLLILGSPDGVLPGTAALLLFRLPAGLLSAVDNDVRDLWKGVKDILQGAQPTTPRVVGRDLAAVERPGPEGSRQRLLQEGQQRMNVPADVGGVHLEQHAQQMHGEVMPQVDQRQQQTVGNIEFELPARPDAAPSSLPQEGRSVRTGPQGFELFSEEREFGGVQAAERLEGSGTLDQARHLKHAVTLPNSPQLRNGS